ncbi:helix-turn-helix domain-containing protein [Aeromicrobium chenweiae]|uniref:AraC family transcriptional regulator n=1 Tax=Aeromicrobium chenweiae TaxID=2079793 RepID=A0A2S0WP30_9ACTN|nr:helix-turn-helix domain-containing protein [Aeromicrobium chenweiae]AWB93103.1 AraC family transcriptional regulator [Aeromicrobium chenweiae]TGN34091.1 AraC family transcriptional regulator [Aeromicrobium chenweiae]
MTDPNGRGEAAILHPATAAQHFSVSRVAPSDRWRRFVEYLWIVRWDVAEPYDQQVIPQPCVHVTAEPWRGVPRLLVNGITREPFVRTLEGSGQVIGATFRPASFRAVLGADLGRVAGRVVPLGDLVGPDDSAAAAALLRPGATDEEMAATLQAHLDACGAVPDPVADELNALVRAAEVDPSITRADQLADHAGVSLRTLQRHFTAYLGIGPKWVVQRFRLLDAAAAAHAGPTDWAALAIELGFADQSHLTRAFTAVVGTPPRTYERRAHPGA